MIERSAGGGDGSEIKGNPLIIIVVSLKYRVSLEVKPCDGQYSS